MAILIESGSAAPVEVANPLETLSSSVRVKRALQFLGLGMGLALLSLPLPGVHFVLVPGFLLFGIGAFFKKLRETRRLSLAGCRCPECGKPLKESLLYFGEDLPRVYCYECRHHLWLAETATSAT